MSFIAVIRNSHLTFNGKYYFRGGSESVLIGSYGEKRTPILQQNYLEVQSNIPAVKLKVRAVTEVAIDFERSTDVKLKLKVAGNYNGSVDAAYNDLKTGVLKLVKFEILPADLATIVNGAPAVLNNLRNYGNDARVAHQIFVVLEASMARTYSQATTITFSMSGTAVRATVMQGGTTTVDLSPGMIYAYLLAKPDWNSGKNRIDKFTDDQWSTS